MKIAVVGQRILPHLNDGKIRGGVEIAEKQQICLLSQRHEVHFITSSDSEAFSKEVRFYPTEPSKTGGLLHNRKTGENRTTKVLGLLNEIQPEVVIVHDFDNAGLLKALARTNFPVVMFSHGSALAAGWFPFLAQAEALSALTASGHTTVSMSEAARVDWAKLCVERKKSLSERVTPENLFNEIFPPIHFWDKPQVEPEDDYFMMIGQLGGGKKTKLGLEAAQGTSTRVVLCTNTPRTPEDVKYLEALQKLGGEIHVAAPRTQISSLLRRARAVLMFSDESFGIVAAESNLHGVPVILCHKNYPHPVEEVCGGENSNGVVRVDFPSKAEGIPNLRQTLADFAPRSLEERAKISENIWMKLSSERILDSLEKLLLRAIVRFKDFSTTNPEDKDSTLSLFGV